MFIVYETYKKENPTHNYVGKSSSRRVFTEGYKGSGVMLNAAFKKYGKKAFDTKVLTEFESEKKAYDYEVEMIAKMKPYYNVAAGGLGMINGIKLEDTHKQSISKGLKKYYSNNTLNDRQKQNIDWRGRNHNENTIEKMRNGQSGEEHNQYRHDVDNEHLRSLRESGLSYREIAEKVGLTKSGAMKRIKKFV